MIQLRSFRLLPGKRYMQPIPPSQSICSSCLRSAGVLIRRTNSRIRHRCGGLTSGFLAHLRERWSSRGTLESRLGELNNSSRSLHGERGTERKHYREGSEYDRKAALRVDSGTYERPSTRCSPVNATSCSPEDARWQTLENLPYPTGLSLILTESRDEKAREGEVDHEVVAKRSESFSLVVPVY